MPGEELRKEIQHALRFDERFGGDFREDEKIAGMIRKYRELIQRTDSLMDESGVGEACGRCAEAKGSCCFREMGESYGFLQLYVNVLLGSCLPEKADFPESCHFVGRKGCKLLGRHSFCLNYFCPDLKKQLGRDAIGKLERLIGEQLQAGWELELFLNRRIAGKLIELI